MWYPANGILSLILAVIGISLVLAFTYYASRLYAGKMGPVSGGRLIKILDRVALGKNGALVLIELAGVQYLVSVSEHGTQMLKELDEPVKIPETAAPVFDFSNMNFRGVLDRVKLKKG